MLGGTSSRAAKSPTLRISRKVLEGYPAFAVAVPSGQPQRQSDVGWLALAHFRTDSELRCNECDNSYPNNEQGRARDIRALYGNHLHLLERNSNGGRVPPSTYNRIAADGRLLDPDPLPTYGGYAHILAGILRQYAVWGSILNLPAGAGTQVADQEQQ